MIALLLACNGGLGPLNDNPDSPDVDSDLPEDHCGEDVAVFEEHVWEPVMADSCAICHLEGGVADASGFHLDPDDLLSSLRAASGVADKLLVKPTGLETHGGGVVIELDSPEYEALEFWVDWTYGECALPENPDLCEDQPGHRALRRLTHDEYDHTVSDLLGLDSAYGQSFAADPTVDGWANDHEALVVPPLLADQYRGAAEELSRSADLESLVSCDPYAIGHQACATLFIEGFGLRAFRRPLTEEDVARYMALWREIALEDGFDEAVRWVIAAMLQSPHFLYRSELGVDDNGAYVLTDWELASALSYSFWGTMPDDLLLAEAEAGTLDIQEQAERLAADPRATENTQDLVATWLELELLNTVSRDGLTDELRAEMRENTDALVADHAETTLSDLMGSGLLSERSVLTTHALPTGSSPIHRGLLVRQRLLCEELPPPPANLDTSPPEVDPNLSTRERYAEHASNPECSGCHDKIDPIGFGFEHYDGLGLWRDSDAGHPIDDSGQVDGVDFDGVDGLSELLVDDPRFNDCYVETWRRHLSGTESCSVDAQDVEVTGPRMEYTQRAHFTHRTGDGGDTVARGQRIDLSELPEDDVDFGGNVEFSFVGDYWSTGWCGYGTVTNHGSEPATWEARVDANGTLNNNWSSTVTVEGDTWVFTGNTWNATLDPAESVEFGWCAAY